MAMGLLRIDASQGQSPRTVGLIFPGQIVAHPFDADPCGTAIVAVTRSDICLHARGDLQHVTERYPGGRRLLLHSAFQTLAETRRWMLVISRPRARERVAAFLVSIAEKFPTSATTPSISCSVVTGLVSFSASRSKRSAVRSTLWRKRG
ncbi:MAG TPA: hypothetical protein VGO17_12825 [Aurantimonas sp.]|nr:hypothetical protein [Aurantimonas sp.]